MIGRRALGAGLIALGAMPQLARAQSARVPVIGFLNSRTPTDAAAATATFREGLKEAGFEESRNTRIEYRWAGGYDKIKPMAAELAARPVDVLFAAGSTATAQIARETTNDVPIVFAIGQDPVEIGLVKSLARPGGNVTGAQARNGFAAKNLEILGELRPDVRRIGMLIYRSNPSLQGAEAVFLEAARAARLFPHIRRVTAETDLPAAFLDLAEQRVDAAMIAPEGFFVSLRTSVVALAAQHAIPFVYHVREFVEAGGLVSLGANLPEAYRQGGRYVGRILAGEKPGDLPVVRTNRIEVAINMKAAKALRVTVPASVLARADEVIE